MVEGERVRKLEMRTKCANSVGLFRSCRNRRKGKEELKEMMVGQTGVETKGATNLRLWHVGQSWIGVYKR